MYDHIEGLVIEKSPARAVLRAGGVGYELKVSLGTSSRLSRGQTQQLFTILHVVDGMPSLLGFISREERELARRVLNVTGVGPAIALAILSVFTPDEFARIVASDDLLALKRVKGIGNKTAERLCLELRDVLPKLDLGTGAGAPAAAALPQSANDAITALVALGYSEKEARDKVDRARGKQPAGSTEELVKTVLQM